MSDVIDLSPDEIQEQRRARKAQRRRFDAETAPADLKAAGVAEEMWPTKANHKTWWKYIIPSLGVTPEGYWYGHCPLHDGAGTDENPTALISFRHGTMRCLNVDSDCHKGKLAMSLNNAFMAIAQRTANVDGDLG